MSAAKKKPVADIGVEDYLEGERAAEFRHEYFDGVIIAMAGESHEHALISNNTNIRIANLLSDKPCIVLTKDTKVRSGPPRPFSRLHSKGMFSYPDIVVICGEPEFYDDRRDIILNPKVIVEVLSPSTELFDRTEKFNNYRIWNPKLTDYILVSQKEAFVEHFQRTSENVWTITLASGMTGEIKIDSIDATMKLADIYKKVVFPEVKTKSRNKKKS